MNYKMYLRFILCFIFYSTVIHAQDSNKSVIDSIDFYLKNSKNSTLYDANENLLFAIRAKELSETYKLDSLSIKSLINLSSIHSKNGDNSLFIKYNHQALALSKQIKDVTSQALISKNLGYYYYDKVVDSAYYYNAKAEKLYSSLNDKFNTAVVLLDIALLQFNDKDYTGGELVSIDGLALLDQLKETNEVVKYKSFFYNNLGMIFRQLEQYDESIDYYKKALNIQKKMFPEGNIIINRGRNNLGNTYRDSEQYAVALDYFNDVLSTENLINENPSFYAVVLDNYAQTMYLSKKYDKLPKLYLKALRICDSIDDRYNSIAINLHLGAYYHNIQMKDSAKYYAYRAKNISKDFFTDDLLESYRLLYQIEEDSIAINYYSAYIKLQDSILKVERATRNKFGRILYETDKLEKENVEITKQRMWLLIISVVIIIASFLLYLFITQRNKNKELQFIQKQQQTNEEIYNLMLSQNENIEEARTIEKKRISEELHDGVLGRLFGTRLSLDSLNMSNSPDAIKTRSQYIDELKTIEEDIRKVSHELNTDFVSGSGFIDIIKTLVETQTLAYNLTYTLNHEDSISWDDISNKKKIHIYRIIQESLHNIYKHAHATKVNISFTLKKNVICLTITDNGSGYDVNKAKSGIGLKNMNSRIKEINGKLQIVSEKEQGTTVSIKVPLP